MAMFTRVRVLRSRRNAVARKSKRHRHRIRMPQDYGAKAPAADLEGLLSFAGRARALPRATPHLMNQLAVQLQRSHGNYFTQRGLIPGLNKKDCRNLPRGVPDEIRKLCEIGGSDCFPV